MNTDNVISFFTDQDPRPGVGDEKMGETSKFKKGNQDGNVVLSRAPISDKFIPLQTTSELFESLTEVFVTDYTQT